MRTDLLASGAQSRLHIAGATFTDSGNYTCMMGRTAKTQIELQIIPGGDGDDADDGDDDDDGVNMLKLLQIPDRIYFFIMMADAGKKWGWSMVVIMMLVDHRSFSR